MLVGRAVDVPGLTPPPNSRLKPHCGQWSRPALPLIRGERPISPITTTSVESSRPRSSRSSISAGMTLVEQRQVEVLEHAEVVLVHVVGVAVVPKISWCTLTNGTPASTSRRATSRLSRQVAAVAVAHAVAARGDRSKASRVLLDVSMAKARCWNLSSRSMRRRSLRLAERVVELLAAASGRPSKRSTRHLRQRCRATAAAARRRA